MERMLGAQGGLHRRAALECRLDPFSVPEARSFLPSIPAADFITAYSVCGGYPLHLDRWDESSSVDDNLIEGGQGDAIQRTTEQRLQQHIGRVFESACREHAARLVRDGELPPEMIIGRWWRDEIG